LDPVRGDFGLTALRAKAVSQLEGSGLPASTDPYWRFGATVLGPVFTGFAGKSIAARTSVELRLYRTTGSTAATAGFIGLRLSL
ncbi:MAG: hypothetical protein ABR508_07020, partial [Candidatus Baltobacteraceae bacterium]